MRASGRARHRLRWRCRCNRWRGCGGVGGCRSRHRPARSSRSSGGGRRGRKGEAGKVPSTGGASVDAWGDNASTKSDDRYTELLWGRWHGPESRALTAVSVPIHFEPRPHLDPDHAPARQRPTRNPKIFGLRADLPSKPLSSCEPVLAPHSASVQAAGRPLSGADSGPGRPSPSGDGPGWSAAWLATRPMRSPMTGKNSKIRP